jgi:hypothetical protein
MIVSRLAAYRCYLLHVKLASHVHSAFTGHVASVPLHSTAMSRTLEVNCTLGSWCIFFYTLQRMCQANKNKFSLLLSSPLLFEIPYI